MTPFFRLFLAVMALVALSCTARRALADETPAAVPKAPLKSWWVHFFECPAATKAKPYGTQYVVLVFVDGTTLVLNTSALSDEKREMLKQFVGAVEGYNVAFDCGTTS
jgi:hypothetical protein